MSLLLQGVLGTDYSGIQLQGQREKLECRTRANSGRESARNAEAGNPPKPFGEENLQFGAHQELAQAHMRSSRESQMRARLTIEIEARGVRILLRIPPRPRATCTKPYHRP